MSADDEGLPQFLNVDGKIYSYKRFSKTICEAGVHAQKLEDRGWEVAIVEKSFQGLPVFVVYGHWEDREIHSERPWLVGG